MTYPAKKNSPHPVIVDVFPEPEDDVEPRGRARLDVRADASVSNGFAAYSLYVDGDSCISAKGLADRFDHSIISMWIPPKFTRVQIRDTPRFSKFAARQYERQESNVLMVDGASQAWIRLVVSLVNTQLVLARESGETSA